MGFMKVIPCSSTEMEPEYRNTKVLDWLCEGEKMWDKTLCPHHCNRQCELFPIGSIVYYVKHSTSVSNMYFVHWGVVIEHYSGQISLQLYDWDDTRTINGVPIKEFDTPTKWKKLPKGWTYNTKMFELSQSQKYFDQIQPLLECIDLDNYSDLSINLSRHSPEYLFDLIEKGLLVKMQHNDYAQIDTEISKEHGWRIIRKYNSSEHHSPYITLNIAEVYATFEEAKAVIDDMKAEWERQANLSDYEWSVEQIDKNLDMWCNWHHVDDETKLRYRRWILNLDNIEEVETRIISGCIEWRYAKNKRWKKIELSV